MITDVLGLFFFLAHPIKMLGFNAMTRAQQVYLKVTITEILVVLEEWCGQQSQGERPNKRSDVFEVCWKGIVATID